MRRTLLVVDTYQISGTLWIEVASGVYQLLQIVPIKFQIAHSFEDSIPKLAIVGESGKRVYLKQVTEPYDFSGRIARAIEYGISKI